MPPQVNQRSQTQAAPIRMQPPQVQEGHLMLKSVTKRVPVGMVSTETTTQALNNHYERLLPVHHVQCKTIKGSNGEYCGKSSLGIGPHWLPVPGTEKRERREHPVSNWALHPLCTGLHHAVTDCPTNHKSLVRLFHHPLWVTRKDSILPRKELQGQTGYLPLQINQCQEAKD